MMKSFPFRSFMIFLVSRVNRKLSFFNSPPSARVKTCLLDSQLQSPSSNFFYLIFYDYIWSMLPWWWGNLSSLQQITISEYSQGKVYSALRSLRSCPYKGCFGVLRQLQMAMDWFESKQSSCSGLFLFSLQTFGFQFTVDGKWPETRRCERVPPNAYILLVSWRSSFWCARERDIKEMSPEGSI